MTVQENQTAHAPSRADAHPTGDANAMPSDAAMGRAIVRGCAIGVPIVFVVLLAIELIAGMDLVPAAVCAALPAGIFGAFIGSAWCIGQASDAAHAIPRAPTAPG